MKCATFCIFLGQYVTKGQLSDVTETQRHCAFSKIYGPTAIAPHTLLYLFGEDLLLFLVI